MFGGLSHLMQPATIGPPPKDVPPPTPVVLPQCNPQLSSPSDASAGSTKTSDDRSEPSLVRFLQTLHRPTDLSHAHFRALGVHVHTDAPAESVLPDPSYLPSSTDWDGMSVEEAHRKDADFRRSLSSGNLSPDARTYLDRRNELSTVNQAAFRTVRRIKPEPGRQPPRLGNCYEFFKQLEFMASYWDDTSLPQLPDEGENQHQDKAPALPPRPHPIDTSIEQAAHAMVAAASESNTRSQPESESQPKAPERVTYRTSRGSQMPPEHRHNLVASFVKLVSYNFGCNVTPPRVEPRLHLVEPPTRKVASKARPSQAQKASCFPSGCVFLFRTPSTREAARAGIVEGPIAAVSARNTTNFITPTESNIDFGRELVAALLTAQHRARQGKAEKRFGEGKWWATAKRWGGGEGGPIGREVEGDSVVGDKDATGSATASAPSEGPEGASHSATEKSATQEKGNAARSLPIPVRGPPVSKKPRKNLSMYDAYRMVRLPSSNWDKKTRYETIGKVKGADYDDVFVISSLFHHLSILRVRVPSRLLEVMDGGSDEAERADGSGRSWGKLEMWRSRWFDLFLVEDRLEAMRLLWGMMAWMMRKDDETDKQGDATMKNA